MSIATTPVTFRGRTLFVNRGPRVGIDIRYVKSRRVLQIGGWYDSIVGIEGGEVALGEFLRGLGITAQDCAKALKDQP